MSSQQSPDERPATSKPAGFSTRAMLARLGVSTEFVDVTDLDAVEKASSGRPTTTADLAATTV